MLTVPVGFIHLPMVQWPLANRNQTIVVVDTVREGLCSNGFPYLLGLPDWSSFATPSQHKVTLHKGYQDLTLTICSHLPVPNHPTLPSLYHSELRHRSSPLPASPANPCDPVQFPTPNSTQSCTPIHNQGRRFWKSSNST